MITKLKGNGKKICLCCVLNYLVILLNSTDFCIFPFGNLVFYSFVGYGCITSISTFETPITNFCAFSLKMIFIGCLISVMPIISIIPRLSILPLFSDEHRNNSSRTVNYI